jgi:hypothetical protein
VVAGSISSDGCATILTATGFTVWFDRESLDGTGADVSSGNQGCHSVRGRPDRPRRRAEGGGFAHVSEEFARTEFNRRVSASRSNEAMSAQHAHSRRAVLCVELDVQGSRSEAGVLLRK